MSLRMHPRNMATFRDTTRGHHKMAGVSFFRFMCKRCGKSKPTTGRKSLGPKQGFQCADCCAGKVAG